MRKNNNAKPLFDLSQTDEPKKKRGRPKKSEQEKVQPIKEKQEQKSRKVKETKIEKTPEQKTKVKPSIIEDEGWMDFSKSKPELFAPIEFYVDTGKAKKDIFRGYIRQEGETVTNDPYKLVILRKKYGNLYYREIYGCTDIRMCPKEFPFCENCKTKKQTSKK